jgi:archaellum component FlaC
MLVSTSFTYAQLKVMSSGNVGINNSNPAYRLDIEGTGRFSGWTDILINWTGDYTGAVIFPENDCYLQLGKSGKRLNHVYSEHLTYTWAWNRSDDNLKTDKRPIENALALVNGLQGKKYKFTNAFLDVIPDSIYPRMELKKDQFGYIAQEVKEVLPELVMYDSITETYSVNYTGVIPVLSEAIKEQQTIINNLQNTVSNLSETLASVNQSVIALQNCCNQGGGDGTGKILAPSESINKSKLLERNRDKSGNIAVEKNSTEALLFQNNPNPFNDRTEIKFYLPTNASVSKIIIYNLSGEQINAYTINNNGLGMQSINIEAGNLSAGAYYYTLLVDGKEIDTKKMILLK